MKNFQLLLVSADEDFVSPIADALTEQGFAVTLEKSVESAAQQAKAQQSSGQPFALAVIDLKLERPDGGFTLSYYLKRDSAQLPIILLSDANGKMGTDFSLDNATDKNWMKADAFLQKPVRFEQLLYETQRLLGIDNPTH